jgi:hypothetical protein
VKDNKIVCKKELPQGIKAAIISGYQR